MHNTKLHHVILINTRSRLVSRIEAYEEFGLRYDSDSETWKVITSTNLSTSSVFVLQQQDQHTGTNADASWWFKFTNDGNTYTVQYRKLDYIFESESQNKFHYDVEEKFTTTRQVRVSRTRQDLKNKRIVSTGNSIGYPITWQVVDTVNRSRRVPGQQESQSWIL